MTRKKQINLYLKERNIPITSLEANSIIEGIKWADEHPNLCEEDQVGMNELGMMWQKQALIKKACEYLKSLVYPRFVGDTLERAFSDEDIERFKKAMEE